MNKTVSKTGRVAPGIIKKGMSEKYKRNISIIVIVLAILLLTAGIQSLIFYNTYSSEIYAANEKLNSLIVEKTRRGKLVKIWQQIWQLDRSVNPEHEAATPLKLLLGNFRETAGIVPKEVTEQMIIELPVFKQAFPESAGDIDQLVTQIEQLQGLYDVHMNRYWKNSGIHHGISDPWPVC